MGLLLTGLRPEEYGNKSGTVTTYTDLTDLSRSVVIWEFMYFIEGWEFYITMDAETEKIIGITYNQIDGPDSFAVTEDGESTSMVDTDTLLKPFQDYADYLGVSWTKINIENFPFLIHAETQDPNVSYNFVITEGSAYSIHLAN